PWSPPSRFKKTGDSKNRPESRLFFLVQPSPHISGKKGGQDLRGSRLYHQGQGSETHKKVGSGDQMGDEPHGRSRDQRRFHPFSITRSDGGVQPNHEKSG